MNKVEMKVNIKKINIDKPNRPNTSQVPLDSPSIENFRQYISTLETTLKETLIENLKLKQQLNDYLGKKSPIDIKKAQVKAEESIKKYSKGKMYLNEIEKKIQLKPLNQIVLKDGNKNGNSNGVQSNDQIKNLIAQYESQLEAIISKKSHIEDKLNTSEKEKEDLKNKFKDEFVLMSSVIYNLGFLYWSMKSDYEDKLKQNKGWLEMERIKQYNGDY